jgi:outer membrane protein TolC
VLLLAARSGFMAAMLVLAAPLVARAETAVVSAKLATPSAAALEATVDTDDAAGTTDAAGTVDAADAAAAIATADTLRLSLSEAVARALKSSAHLAAMEATQRGTEAAVRGARAAGLPVVDLSAGYTRYSDVPEFVLTLPGRPPVSIAPNIPDGWRTRASVSVPLFTGGRIANAAEAARGERDAAGNDLAAVRADLVLETTTAYWNLRLQTESASVVGEALAAYESHLVDARHRAEVGLAARSEVLAVEVERDRAELGRVQAEGAVAVAQESLRRLLGVGEWVVLVAMDQPEDGQTPVHFGGDRGRSAALDSLVATALATRPERTALAARVAAAEARVRFEQGARRPQLAAVAGYDYANPNRRITPGQAEWKETWDASMNLSLPLFDSGRISAAIARARAQAEALRHQATDLDQRIRFDVTLRVIERRNAEQAVAVAERAVDSAQENEKVTRDRYREGVASSSDLLDAEVKSLRASLDRTDALARLLLARANLARAVGRLR